MRLPCTLQLYHLTNEMFYDIMLKLGDIRNEVVL